MAVVDQVSGGPAKLPEENCAIRALVADLPGEFNVWSDPDAAAIVLQSGVMATWVGLDVTRRVRLARSEAEAMAGDPANARIAVDVDPEGFGDHFTGCLRRLR